MKDINNNTELFDNAVVPEIITMKINVPSLKDEDAPAIARKGFLLVADGLGGAGCYRHENIRLDVGGLLRLEDQSYALDSFRDVLQERHLTKTSAYIGSRLAASVINSYVAQNKKAIEQILDPETEEKGVQRFTAGLTAYLDKNLSEMATRLRIHEDKRAPAGIFHTTAAFCFYKGYESEGKRYYDVVSIWSGDSRCYVLTENGVSLLTNDHESETGGSMVRWIRLNRNANGAYRLAPPRFQYNIVRGIAAPAVFFATSDGFFDPVEGYFGGDINSVFADYMLTHTLACSESLQEWENSIREFCVKTQPIDGLGLEMVWNDDRSLALAAEEEFLELKEKFTSGLDSLYSRVRASIHIFEERYIGKNKSDAAVKRKQDFLISVYRRKEKALLRRLFELSTGEQGFSLGDDTAKDKIARMLEEKQRRSVREAQNNVDIVQKGVQALNLLIREYKKKCRELKSMNEQAESLNAQFSRIARPMQIFFSRKAISSFLRSAEKDLPKSTDDILEGLRGFLEYKDCAESAAAEYDSKINGILQKYIEENAYSLITDALGNESNPLRTCFSQSEIEDFKRIASAEDKVKSCPNIHFDALSAVYYQYVTGLKSD